MLTLSGAARTLIVWFTLFFAWSAYVLWHCGADMARFIMSDSNLFVYDLAMRTLQGDMMPPGVITALLVLSVLAAGSLLATVTLHIWHTVLLFPALFNRHHSRQRATIPLQK